jgi:hypothetical protein
LLLDHRGVLVIRTLLLLSLILPVVANAYPSVSAFAGPEEVYGEVHTANDNTNGYTHALKIVGTHTVWFVMGQLWGNSVGGITTFDQWSVGSREWVQQKPCPTCAYVDIETGAVTSRRLTVTGSLSPMQLLDSTVNTVGETCQEPYALAYTLRLVRIATANANGTIPDAPGTIEYGHYVYPPTGWSC